MVENRGSRCSSWLGPIVVRLAKVRHVIWAALLRMIITT
jgi:hypothetical protein